jgi:hypothetical protein
MKSARSVPIHLLLLLYILISGTYQVVAAVSIVVGFFDLRHQVHLPFEVDYKRPTITSVAEGAHKAGLKVNDTIESLNVSPIGAKHSCKRCDGTPEPVTPCD